MATTNVATIDGTFVQIDDATLQDLRSRLRGPLLQQGDDGYHDACRIWNGMIQRRPSLIARCTGTADVVEAVKFASEHRILMSVRGGGHNVAGSALSDGDLTIDLSQMHGVHVDVNAQTVRVQGGAIWGEVDRETQLFGLATPSGYVSTTGVGGFTLGGGYGALRRKYGITCDQLLSVDIVTPDGKALTANEKQYADLFWAVRGGGGNFGVVTSFEFRCYPVGPTVFLCAPAYPIESANDVLRRWRDYMAQAPDDLSSNALLWGIPEGHGFPKELAGRSVAILAMLYPGSPEEGERITRPVREFGTPLLDLSGPLSYVAAQAAFDPFFPMGTRRYYWKAIDLNDLNDEVIDHLVDAGKARPNASTLIPIWHFGGAMTRVDPTASAFWRRNVPFMVSFDATWDDPADDQQCINWAREAWESMRAYSDGGHYVNFPGMGEEGDALVRGAYGGNYERLAAIKAKYDPANLFRSNLNIRPAGR